MKINNVGVDSNFATKRNKFLVLDSRIIDKTTGARLTLGEVKKSEHNPLFTEDKPWEPRFDNVYANVIYDEEDNLYKCWYSPFIIDERTTSTPPEKRNPESLSYMDVRPNKREMGVCYAISKDGINWEKPELGLVEFNGSKKNNILLRGEQFKGVFSGPHGAGVFKDYHEQDPAKRYKMFFKANKMAVAFSPDGLRWDQWVSCPQIKARGDTHNNAFWAPGLKKYIGITRLWNHGRLVGRTESPDFVNWTKSQVVLEGLKPHLQPHDMIGFAYCSIYIGLVGLFNTDKKVDRQHVELAWSPDTVKWHRVNPGTPLIPNSENKGDYDWGCIFASAPVFMENEIQIYYGGNNGNFFSWRDGFLCLAMLRPDGFAGYEPTSAEIPAIIVTKPLICQGRMLCITADVKDGGYIRVTMLDEDDEKLASSELVSNSVTDGQVEWIENLDWADISDKKIRLKFELQNAKIYAFQI